MGRNFEIAVLDRHFFFEILANTLCIGHQEGHTGGPDWSPLYSLCLQ